MTKRKSLEAAHFFPRWQCGQVISFFVAYFYFALGWYLSKSFLDWHFTLAYGDTKTHSSVLHHLLPWLLMPPIVFFVNLIGLIVLDFEQYQQDSSVREDYSRAQIVLIHVTSLAIVFAPIVVLFVLSVMFSTTATVR